MTIFPTKILLATDGSEEAELALRTAVDLASSTGSELHVVTVGHEYRPPYDISEYDHLLEEDLREATLRRLEREARDVVNGQVRKIEKAGGTVAKAHLRAKGRPDQDILDLAEELSARLIVMGAEDSVGYAGLSWEVFLTR